MTYENYLYKIAQDAAEAAVAQEIASVNNPNYEKRRRVVARVLASLAGGLVGAGAGVNIALQNSFKPFASTETIKRKTAKGAVLGALAGIPVGLGANYFKDRVLGLDPLMRNVAIVKN